MTHDKETNLDSISGSEERNPAAIIFDEYSQDLLNQESRYLNQHISDVVDDLKWRLTSIQVYSVKGEQIFSADYSSTLTKLDSGIVMMFYDALQKFATNNLKTRLVDFKVADERIIFSFNNNNLYLITANLGKKARSGLSSNFYVTNSNLITNISSNLFFLGDQTREDKSSFQQEIVAMVASINQNVLLEEHEYKLVDHLNISQVVISDGDGMPVLTRTYEGSIFQDDPMLFSMFLHSLNVFFQLNFSDELKEINFGSARLYVRNSDGKFYAIMVQFDEFIDLREDSPIHQIAYSLLDRIITLISSLGDDLEVIPSMSLEQMVDNFIFKAQLQLDQRIEDVLKNY